MRNQGPGMRALIVLLLLMAGCVEDSGRSSQESMAPVEPEIPVENDHNEISSHHSFSPFSFLVEGPVQLIGSPMQTVHIQGNNCMEFEGFTRIQNATIVAAWTSDVDLPLKLEVSSKESYSVTGTSPLTIELLNPEYNIRNIAVGPAGTGAMLAELTLTMEGIAETGLASTAGTCP